MSEAGKDVARTLKDASAVRVNEDVLRGDLVGGISLDFRSFFNSVPTGKLIEACSQDLYWARPHIDGLIVPTSPADIFFERLALETNFPIQFVDSSFSGTRVIGRMGRFEEVTSMALVLPLLGTDNSPRTIIADMTPKDIRDLLKRPRITTIWAFWDYRNEVSAAVHQMFKGPIQLATDLEDDVIPILELSPETHKLAKEWLRRISPPELAASFHPKEESEPEEKVPDWFLYQV